MGTMVIRWVPHVQTHIYRHPKAHFEWDDFVRFRELCNINITEVKGSDGLWSICICEKIGYPKTHWIIIMHPIHMLFWMHLMFEQSHLLGRCSRRLICTRRECDFPTSEACVVVTPRWIIEHIGQLLEDATLGCLGHIRQTVLMYPLVN